jgi:hypothetical protein
MSHAISEPASEHVAVNGRSFWNFGTVTVSSSTGPRRRLPNCIYDDDDDDDDDGVGIRCTYLNCS